ncbi:MAG: hypothetical protein LBM20_00185 [Rikenellaceae bacterium]|jgi:hypothetical protein|nr:hypothetical protein [Rikenellaceae bacterium]
MKNRFLFFALSALLVLGAGSSCRKDGPENPDESKTDVLTRISDPVFLAYCGWQMLQWDTDNNGKLSPAEAAAVEIMDCGQTEEYTGAKIESLAGIEYFTGLKYLKCDYNELTALDVSKNTKLIELNCRQNQLVSLDVSQLTALIVLNGHTNQLTALDVSTNSALTQLACHNNSLTSLDVSKNSALSTLVCNNNSLSSLDVSKNSALTGLDCTGNRLTVLDLSQNTALTVLGCAQNQLTTLDLSQNSALNWLNCVNNQLTALDITRNTALALFECFGNPGDGVSMLPVRAWFDNDAIPQDFTARSWTSDGRVTRVVYYTGPTPPEEDETPLYESSDYSQDGQMTLIQRATEGAGIDIVLMGDGYSDRQIASGEYAEAIRLAADNLFTVEPFQSFKHLFNIYTVTVVSKNEGYTSRSETALEGSFFGTSGAEVNNNTCFTYTQKAIADSRMNEALIVVMMNSDSYNGTCYFFNPDPATDYGSGVTIACFSEGSNEVEFARLLHHEANGHGFAKLDDEYISPENADLTIPTSNVTMRREGQTLWGWFKNVDFTTDLSTIRWHDFIRDPRYVAERLGAYEGATTYGKGVWRPTENSIMRDNSGEFNAPSREAIYYRIHKLAYGASWRYSYEEFVAWDMAHRSTPVATRSASVGAGTVLKPVPHTPPVVLPYSWQEAK